MSDKRHLTIDGNEGAASVAYRAQRSDRDLSNHPKLSHG